jgi:phytoene synthase
MSAEFGDPAFLDLPPDERRLARPIAGRSAGQNYGFSGDTTDLGSCTASIRKGSKSFHIASLILPRRTRQAAHALYAFCRHSDDLIDDGARRPDTLPKLRHRLDLIYEGTPSDHACDRAFARIAHVHSIPKGIPLSLLDGFSMDLEDRRFATIAEVKDYAARVAATVGLMMSLVMRAGDRSTLARAGDRSTLARAADLGLAMQLTNIARDVGEDARNGRLYLPLDWLGEAGIDAEEFLRDPRFSPALGGVVRRLLAEADRHYRLGHAGIGRLPAACRPAIRTAALTYQDIGRSIARNGYDTVSQRARTTLPRKLALVLRALRPLPMPPLSIAAALAEPADASVAGMVEAAAEACRAAGTRIGSSAAPASGMDRVASILIEVQLRRREDRRLKRLERWEKAARLV